MSTPDAAEKAEAPRPDLDARPPLLGSWRNIYLVVLGNLALLVVIFWAITRAFE